jgi:transcriptional regulator with XRE-family HTH domain
MSIKRNSSSKKDSHGHLTFIQELGSTIKELRMENEVSAKVFAKEIGISLSLISQIEQGRRMPSWETFNKICKYFKISSFLELAILTIERVRKPLSRKEKKLLESQINQLRNILTTSLAVKSFRVDGGKA